MMKEIIDKLIENYPCSSGHSLIMALRVAANYYFADL